MWFDQPKLRDFQRFLARGLQKAGLKDVTASAFAFGPKDRHGDV
jgi:hypothetical protein